MNDDFHHPETLKQLETFLALPSHALLIYGPRGSGKTATMNHVAEMSLGLESGKLDAYPYKLRLVPDDKQKISVDSIRDNVDHFVTIKVPGTNNVRRVVLIEEADKMTEEAQNALLKNLEEPPSDCLFVLTTSNMNKLLLTVRSRTTIIRIRRPEKANLVNKLQSMGYEDAEINRAIALSGGMPGLALSILRQEETGLVKAAQNARDILSSSAYDRLAMVNTLSKDVILLSDTLQIIQIMAAAALEKSNPKQSERWATILSAAHDAQEMLSDKANAKLNTTRFMLALGQ